MPDSKMKLNPFSAFFHAVLDELKKRLSPAEFSDLLQECKAERKEQDVEAETNP